MKNLLKSLANFQANCPPIKKSSENPFFKSNYASLDSIQLHIKPFLEKNKLLIVQANIIQEGQPYVETTVFDVESGERIVSVFPVVVSKHTAQDYGSAVSYAKRYSLSGLLNLIIEDEDDDGEQATKPTRKEETATEKPWLNENTAEFKKAKEYIKGGGSIADVRKKYNVSKKVADLLNS
jgi:ERF superfamily